MAGNQEEAKFSIKLEDNVSGSASGAADALEKLRQRISGGDDAIKNYSASLRRLKGNSDEIKSAKSELTAKINAEKDAVSSASLQLLKHGSSYDTVAARAKKFTAQQSDLAKKLKDDALARNKEKTEAMSAAISKAGGPVASLRDKIKSYADLAGGEGAGASGLLAFAAAGLAAAVVALGAAFVAGAIALTKWIVRGADAARSMNLLREAASGSASNAYALGTQVDELALKVPTSRKALNEMAIAMAKGGIQGQTLVDTLNAVAQASAALGDDAGNKLKEFIERGRLTQRFQINPLELQGTGLQFDDVAASLAKNMNVGIDKARKALFEGRVKLGDGAKALRDAIEHKFGAINLRQMLSLDNLAKKLGETFDKMTEGVNIEGLLQGISDLAKMFDTSTASGFALKQMVTAFGNAMVTTLQLSMPFIKQFLNGVIDASLDLGLALLDLRDWMRKTFANSDLLNKVDWLRLSLEAGKVAVYTFAAGLALLIVPIGLAIQEFIALDNAMTSLEDSLARVGTSALAFFLDTDWASAGMAIVDGIVNGIKSGYTKALDAVRDLGEGIKKAFSIKIDSHSPSKVFAKYGEYIPQGVAEGVDQGAGEAARAVDNMLAMPEKAASASGGGGSTTTGGPITVNVTINAGGGDVAKQLSDPSVLAPLIKAIEDAILGSGMPVAG